MYKPDGWVMLQQDYDFRIMGSWNGGYIDGDSWRINSGVSLVKETDTHFEFHGNTGSVYRCNKESYGRISPYFGHIPTEYGFDVLSEEDALNEIKMMEKQNG